VRCKSRVVWVERLGLVVKRAWRVDGITNHKLEGPKRGENDKDLP